MLRRSWVFHPFLFGSFPILFLFAHNMGEVPATDVLLPTLVVIIGTLAIFLSLRLVVKSYPKSGIITTCLLVLFFSHGRVKGLVSSKIGFIGGYEGLFVTLLWLLIFVTVTFLVVRSRRNLSVATRCLNITAATLVMISLFNIGVYELKAFGAGERTTDGLPASPIVESRGDLPDIYYIILDGYARADSLRDIYGYDNSKFIGYLTDRGFYVAPQSRSNYLLSVLSISSALNMHYINYSSDGVGTETRDFSRPIEMLASNEVSRFLKNRGYEYTAVFTIWQPDVVGERADLYVKPETDLLGVGLNDFERALIQTTAADGLISPLIKINDSKSVMHAFDVLAAMPEIRGPKFVFAHIHNPMGPLTGLSVSGPEAFEQQMVAGYLEQVAAMNEEVEKLVDSILAKSERPPIIVLQGDHGPPYSWTAELAPEQVGIRRSEIFNAYFLPPNGNTKGPYASISPVNTFRMLFDRYFGTSYGLLEDFSYSSTKTRPYDFKLEPPE
ncbi:MAG: hypothetical protein HYX90_03675 [Chloroflexi bacterium]|nr:hypothetical protein [Chloroflexota bacterium]